MEFRIDVKEVKVEYSYRDKMVELSFDFDKEEMLNEMDLTGEDLLRAVEDHDIDLVVERFGKGELLDEIGIEYVKQHFGLTEIE